MSIADPPLVGAQTTPRLTAYLIDVYREEVYKYRNRTEVVSTVSIAEGCNNICLYGSWIGRYQLNTVGYEMQKANFVLRTDFVGLCGITATLYTRAHLQKAKLLVHQPEKNTQYQAPFIPFGSPVLQPNNLGYAWPYQSAPPVLWTLDSGLTVPTKSFSLSIN